MDRLGVLIERLQTQYQQEAPQAQMLVTIQMIQQEIGEMEVPVPHTFSNVAITMPANFQRPKVIYEITNAEELYGNLDKEIEVDVEEDETADAPPAGIASFDTKTTVSEDDNAGIPLEEDTPGEHTETTPDLSSNLHHHVKTEPDQQTATSSEEPSAATELTPKEIPALNAGITDETPASAESTPDIPAANLSYNPILEVPTLSHQKNIAELNDMMAHHHGESFNEKLRPYQTELGMVLTDTPVKDLKKAIGINDRFLFINELFRGDETMYERSLKTINNFHIFPEAEYWMERELKIKLGWNENQLLVKQFYQLVKRRFSNS